MRYLSLFSMFFIILSPLWAQIQIRPLPEEGFEKRIHDYVYDLEIIDTHEHLMPEKGMINSTMLDFMLLLHHYADDDIKSAGMGKSQFAELLTDKYTVREKWDQIKPFWEASENTAYNRNVLLTIKELFGIDDLNGATVEILSDTIKESYKKGWYDYVLRQRAKIKYAILDVGSARYGNDMFRYLQKFDWFVRVFSAKDLISMGNNFDVKVTTLDTYVDALDKAFQQALDRGIVGVKSALAYHRILDYRDVPKEEAEKVFNKLMNSPADRKYAFDEVKPLQDYMMHRIIGLAREHDLPIQIHTGLQSGDGNIISNSDPALLANLFLQYRDVKFVILHGGYPYGGEFGSLAKNFRNVYLDLAWIYIISPSYSERYLHEWLETVPANKIMAFGGDFHNVEGTFGHSLFAREIISKVLTEKVRTGYFTEEEARTIAKRILYDNAMDLYRLK